MRLRPFLYLQSGRESKFEQRQGLCSLPLGEPAVLLRGETMKLEGGDLRDLAVF
jgi:hypothetical protein